MVRLGQVFGLLLLASAVFGASRTLPLGDAQRGREVFQVRQCSLCHSINGEGGHSAPDLGQQVGRAFAPYNLAGLLWNHSPAMWEAMRKRGISPPQLSEQEAADLFAYFFAAQLFERRGDPGQGRAVFHTKQCDRCHGLDKPVREGIQPVSNWPALQDPIALAAAMWNHAGQMRSAARAAKIAPPRLSALELNNLLSYLRRLPSVQRGDSQFSPASAEDGRQLYGAKGCAGCHVGALALEARPTFFTLTDFAASMWDHSFVVPSEPVPLGYDEMRHIIGYLASMQFFEERGDPERGRKVYAGKRCGACHDDPSSGAPPRTGMAGRMTSFGIAAALWKHGPSMLQKMRDRNRTWPRFEGSDMADLSAYLHGLEFKQRRSPRLRPTPPSPATPPPAAP